MTGCPITSLIHSLTADLSAPWRRVRGTLESPIEVFHEMRGFLGGIRNGTRRITGITEKERVRKMTREEILTESDMLKGNINRMFVTDDPEELECMYEFSKRRLEKIYKYHYARLQSKEGGEK